VGDGWELGNGKEQRGERLGNGCGSLWYIPWIDNALRAGIVMRAKLGHIVVNYDTFEFEFKLYLLL
jgi:hypothetical protein